MPGTLDDRGSARSARVELGAVGLPYHRFALIAGAVCLGATLVLSVPGVAEVRRFRSAASMLSHLALALVALGLSPRFRGWIRGLAALSPRRRALTLAVALVGPLLVIVAGLLMAPSYGHEIFTREWGIVEPLQFVLWLTAAWLAFERARCDGRGTAAHRVFRLAGWGSILMAAEEVDYLGLASLVGRMSGAPGGRIARHHIGGLHDVVNELGKASLVLGVLALLVVVALVGAWARSQGLHRVLGREIFSTTSLPFVGTVAFMAIAQLADIDHPAVSAVLGDLRLVQNLREEPMELLAVICVNATLLSKLIHHPRFNP